MGKYDKMYRQIMEQVITVKAKGRGQMEIGKKQLEKQKQVNETKLANRIWEYRTSLKHSLKLTLGDWRTVSLFFPSVSDVCTVCPYVTLRHVYSRSLPALAQSFS